MRRSTEATNGLYRSQPPVRLDAKAAAVGILPATQERASSAASHRAKAPTTPLVNASTVPTAR
ncbi:hypothetical protein BURKHO8Y_180170 [Burkholderia sp. 8Y]|nr:hypothetical protein BURKHO8Y_180170 [Burkholderia sp. 8Y]